MRFGFGSLIGEERKYISRCFRGGIGGEVGN